MSNQNSDGYKERFPVALRLRRSSLKITQEELAFRAGTAVRYIGHLEQGTRQPSLSIFCALAHALECNPSEFMSDLERQLS